MKPQVPQVTRIQKGSKTVYMANGKVLRNSTKEYKYALFGLLDVEWNPETRKQEASPLHWNLVGFGNNPTNLVNSWKNIFHCIEFGIATIE